MKTKLITALRTTANALEQETFYYDWHHQGSCNCGSLFCALTGKTALEMKQAQPTVPESVKATWTNIIGHHCPITGIPTNKLFKELFSYGLTAQDMVHLEFLSDPQVLAQMNLVEKCQKTIPAKRFLLRVIEQARTVTETKPKKLNYKNKTDVIAYMRAWADLLTEQGKQDIIEKPTNAVAEAA